MKPGATTRPDASMTSRARPAAAARSPTADDPAAADADVGPEPRLPGPVDDVAADDQEVERRARFDPAQSARPGRAPVDAPSRTTHWPLTMTRSMPAGRAAGSPFSVARLAIVAGSKISRSAAMPVARARRDP